jgi:hypothetical protein
MDIDLPGRIGNTRLPHSHSLLPLFEAIVNSIHAVAETSRNSGIVRIFIERDHTQETLRADSTGGIVLSPVRSFRIYDNGVGFTDVHFRSFETSDSRQKASLGGKGIGRFLWLKAFDHAEIDSVFCAADGKHFRRTFELQLTASGVEKHSLSEVAADIATETTVRLVAYKPEYQSEAPRSAETISKKIVEHCVEHFVLGLAPTIFVHDSDSAVVHDLNEIYAAEVNATATVGRFEAHNRKFTVHNLRVLPTYQNGHRLHFCANNRAVTSEPLAGKIPNLVGTLHEGGRGFLYAGYISGDYLDDTVNSERTGFAIPNEDSMVNPGWATITKNATERAAAFVSPYTESMKVEKDQQINNFVQNRAPQYRPLVKHRRELLENIPPNLSEEKLDVELYKANQSYDAQLREESVAILRSLECGTEEWHVFEKRYEKFVEEWNEAGIAKLARHIVHRKATIEFLKASLRVTAVGKYQLENAIHQLIFPLKKTSDDVRSEQMNLWILDEKLTYHYYLASDIPFDQQDIKLPSRDRADIVIFNGPSAFVNDQPPFSSIVLIEFKRPARNDYSDEENPIAQVYKYVELIKSGKATDRGGRPISIKTDTPFYAYVICDLTPTLKRQASFASLVSTPYGLGYFGYNGPMGVYIEVLSFDKLVTDAERRNASLFEQLNLPR